MSKVIGQRFGLVAGALASAALACGAVALKVHDSAAAGSALDAGHVDAARAAVRATPQRATACLTRNHVLTTVSSVREGAYLMPKRVPGLGALPGTALVRFSMALHAAFALDNGTLLFERDNARALRVFKVLLALNLASARAVRGGVDMTKARIEIKSMLRLSGNVVIAWRSYPVHAAARALVARCLG